MTATGAVLALLTAPDAAGGQGVAGSGISVTASELLTVARELAEGLGEQLEAVWVGGLGAGVLESLGAFGVSRVHHLAKAPATTTELASALEELFGAKGQSALLATTSFATRELAARLGVRLGAGVLVDASRIELVDGRLVAERTAFAATWWSRCAVLASPAVVTVKPHSAEPRPAEEALEPELVPLAPGLGDPRVRVVSRTERAATGRPELATASTVVVGGRGTEGKFTVLTELADELGAALGATRVATDEGWVGHELQVGQTGVTINPVLYIGAGVAGAVHHVGGMRAAQTVVAINSDPEAPLMELADYAVVGDLFDVVPRLTARLRELRARATEG